MKENTKFREFRKDKSHSQLEFAEKLKVSRSLIADIERGKTGISKKLMAKLTEVFDVNSGYFDVQESSKSDEINQGVESGSNEDIDNFNAIIKEKEIRKLESRLSHKVPKLLKKVNDPNYKAIDAETLTDKEILTIFADRNCNIHVSNISTERHLILVKITEKQKVIAEKVINELAAENSKYQSFRASILAIQNFEDMLNNITYNDIINDLVKIEYAAGHYINCSTVNEMKAAISKDFSKFELHLSVFKDFAKAVETFVRNLQVLSKETDIDQMEFDGYLSLLL